MMLLAELEPLDKSWDFRYEDYFERLEIRCFIEIDFNDEMAAFPYILLRNIIVRWETLRL